MINLKPLPATDFRCPYDQQKLETVDWLMPGMRCLAQLKCPICNRVYYGDLFAGHGMSYPMLLEAENAKVYHPHMSHVSWFGDWLRDSYLKRSNIPLNLSIETLKPVKQPLVLNCLDGIYGHSLLKLLNAQYHIDKNPDYDIIILVPSFLRWLVPDGIAEIWSLDIPLRDGNQWSDWLNSEIKQRLAGYERIGLSYGLSHPHPRYVDISRFTKVQPFNVTEWQTRNPKVTFIWRDDRLWLDPSKKRKVSAQETLMEQEAKVIELATVLKSAVPLLEFAVCGLSASEVMPSRIDNLRKLFRFPANQAMPSWVQDLRADSVSDTVEREWLKCYASSHIVVGVIGSNMLLPSAHAGAVIDLIPIERFGNNFQEIIFAQQDFREAIIRYTPIILPTSPNALSQVIIQLLKYIPRMLLNFSEEYSAQDLVEKHESLHSTNLNTIMETWYNHFPKN